MHGLPWDMPASPEQPLQVSGRGQHDAFEAGSIHGSVKLWIACAVNIAVRAERLWHWPPR